MGSLDPIVQRELIELFAPLFGGGEAERQALLAEALGADAPAIARLNRQGAAEPFVLRLTEALLESGGASVRELIVWAQARASFEQRARFDLVMLFFEPRSAPARPAVAAGGASASIARLRVFIGSPGDVAEERALALQAIETLNADPAYRDRVHLEPVAWDRPGAGVPMLATMTPQAAIASGLRKPSECDIFAAIFWARMGTPLPQDQYRKPDGSPYRSGTEWEYCDALAGAARTGHPHVLVYRRTEEPRVGLYDSEYAEKRAQSDLVKAFFQEFLNPDGSIRRGCNPYQRPDDFRKDFELNLRSLVARLQPSPSNTPVRFAPPGDTPPTWQGSPFPGLRAFTPADAPIFHGRGVETDRLIRTLAAGTRFVLVAGASGAGKSSLIAAGLIPRLHDNAIEGSKDWLLPAWNGAWTDLRFTPGEAGDNPFLALSIRLAPLLSGTTETPDRLALRLERDEMALAAFIEAALYTRPRWVEALVFIDQLEELFTLCAERHRAPFAALLAAAAASPRLRIVATLRADFYHRCVELPALASLLAGGTFPLGPTGAGALYEMIAGPAPRAGLAFESGLVARVLADVGADPGALALLAFALNELYDTRTAGGALTHAAYDAFGGVQGAISRRAEATFAATPGATGELLSAVFRELVEVDARGEATRRRVAPARVASSPEAAALVEAFTRARLLVSDRATDGAPVVEVAHEALLREWPRLASWIALRTEDFRLRSSAEAAALEWERSGHDPHILWLHERLEPVASALRNLGLDRESLPEPLRSFLRPEADWLLEELKNPQTTYDRRAGIGDRLERIGDARPGIGVRPDGAPDIVWCKIAGGTVALEEVEGTFPVQAFSIARYPITYRQYRAFVDDENGYRDSRWWAGLARTECPGEQYRPIGNHPAENVSWHDAMAFCRWIAARLGYEVRLPTEWEWQQAATSGHPDWEYPWGREWIEGRANTNESRLNRTTAVGLYPGGASVQGAGVVDLSGNVWEWCLNSYENPRLPWDQPSKGVRRALRGGSWYYFRDYARAAFRYHIDPGNRRNYVGFRVVCASLIADSLNPDPLNTGSQPPVKPAKGRGWPSGSARG